MTDELEPLSEDLFRALDVERARPPASAEQLARLASRLDGTFATAPFSPSGVEGSPAAAASGLGAKVGLLMAGLVVGALGGSQLQAEFGAPREVIIERVVEVPVRVEVLVPAPVPVEQPTVKLKEPAREVPAPVRAPIELERLLVEQATSALGRGQGADALAACEEHARRFPAGQLAEERESVAIRALVLLNRRSEAVGRAEAFEKRFPESLLLEVVNTAVK